MKNIPVYLMVVFFTLVYSTSAQSQFWNDDDEPIDEIIVVGQRDYGFAGFGSIFELLDFQELFSDAWLNQFNELLDNANDASEQYCAAQIETWRSDCHHQMNVATATCITSGALVFANALRLLGILGNGSWEIIGGGGLLLSCNELNSRAHLYCDAIADSDSGPQVAQCLGSSN